VQLLVSPEVLEPRIRQLGVPSRVLNVLVPQIGLQRSRIHAVVRQLVSRVRFAFSLSAARPKRRAQQSPRTRSLLLDQVRAETMLFGRQVADLAAG
jgi:hypothetical protein